MSQPSQTHGFLNEVTGKVKENVGWVLGNEKLQNEGKEQALKGEYEVEKAKSHSSLLQTKKLEEEERARRIKEDEQLAEEHSDLKKVIELEEEERKRRIEEDKARGVEIPMVGATKTHGYYEQAVGKVKENVGWALGSEKIQKGGKELSHEGQLEVDTANKEASFSSKTPGILDQTTTKVVETLKSTQGYIAQVGGKIKENVEWALDKFQEEIEIARSKGDLALVKRLEEEERARRIKEDEQLAEEHSDLKKVIELEEEERRRRIEEDKALEFENLTSKSSTRNAEEKERERRISESEKEKLIPRLPLPETDLPEIKKTTPSSSQGTFKGDSRTSSFM